MTGKDVSPVVRLADLELEHFEQGSLFESDDRHFTDRMGLTRLGASYTEVPPGKSSCPYHVHHAEDEMFVVIAGRGQYRFGGTVHEVAAGDVLGAPVGGPEYAHQLVNTGDEPLKYISISSVAELEVCEYPDSGKFLVSSRVRDGDPRLRYVGRRAASLNYWDKEPGA